MSYKIRDLVNGDCIELCDLIKKSAKSDDCSETFQCTPEKLRENAFGSTPNFFCSVVQSEDDNTVVGYAIFYYIYSTWSGRSAFLEKLFVEDNSEKQEMQTALLTRVCKRISARGCVKLRVCSRKVDEATFYTQHGARNLTEVEDWHVFDFNTSTMCSTITNFTP